MGKAKPIPPEYEGQDVSYCGKCKQWKPRADFHKNSKLARGVSARCKICTLEWHHQNAERLSQKAHEWQRNNPEKAREHQRKWKANHPEEVKEWSSKSQKRRWQRAKADPVLLEEERRRKREFARIFHKRNPTLTTEKHHKRKARMLGCDGSFTTAEWKQLCDHYGNVCLCCGEQKPLTVDHVVPISLGGANSIDNIQPLCGTCNSSKGAKVIDYRTNRA